ncbi:hypothetical protein H4R99_004946 [Coemansia sp. RSA 1722]|nr:hypothetical protein LPJ57_004532 [Coemansia sp. RSA 486]KAJ2226656.1 hypothetical protein IWW45_007364 [Coemansia sp. RSA 485]KAJ2596392.1 hypothetical protein H4R99_004946 [Coemansia sp. RSA 1722]
MASPFKTPEFAVAKDKGNTTHPRVSWESDSTAVDGQHYSTESNKLAPQAAIDVVKPAKSCDAAEISASYCTALDSLIKDYLDTEDIYHLDFDCGVFWGTEDAHETHNEAVAWLSRIATRPYTDCKALHLGVQYLDQFLLFKGIPRIKMALPTDDKDILETDPSKQALQEVAQILYWCTSMVKGADGKTFIKTVKLPTTIDLPVLAFQRAAIELPGRFAEEQQQSHNEQQGAFVCYFAIRPFSNACRLANILLCEQGSLQFRRSELAAACFFTAAQPGGIDPRVFLRCTGYTLELAQPAIVYAQSVCGPF